MYRRARSTDRQRKEKSDKRHLLWLVLVWPFSELLFHAFTEKDGSGKEIHRSQKFHEQIDAVEWLTDSFDLDVMRVV